MTTTVIQRSFAGGEVAPGLYARADQNKFQTGLKTCLNFVVRKQGGLARRIGTTKIDTVRNNASQFRQLQFIFRTGDVLDYVLADGWIRIYKNRQRVVNSDAPAWVTSTAYVQGDIVVNSGSVYYCKIAHTAGAVFANDLAAGKWVLQTADYYEFEHPWAAGDLRSLKFVQSGDVLFVVHPSYRPYKISRFTSQGGYRYKVELVSFNSTLTRVAAGSITGTAGANRTRYKFTWSQRKTNYESLVATRSVQTITALGNSSNPTVELFGTGLGLAVGDTIEFATVNGMPELDNTEWIIKTWAEGGGRTQLTLVDLDTTDYGTFLSGSVWIIEYVLSAAGPSAANPITITSNPIIGAFTNFYRFGEQGWGFIGSSETGTIVDTGFTPDTTDVPPKKTNAFQIPAYYPSTVAIVGQRMVFGGKAGDPEVVEMSRIGDFINFVERQPLQDDDPISFRLAGRTVANVKHVIELSSKIIIFTESSEWVLLGNVDGIVTPSAINPKAQSSNGSGDLAPIVINDTALYVDPASIVRDLKYYNESDAGNGGYKGKDLTVFSGHLFEATPESPAKSLVAWDYQRRPHSVVWAVRDDGVLLGLTYLPEHEIWGWHRHTTDGAFRDVVCLPESASDHALYFIVERNIDGVLTRYIECSATLDFYRVALNATFMDCAKSYDNRTSAQMVLTTAGSWDGTDLVTITSTSAIFAPTDVGDASVAFWQSTANGDVEEVFRVEIATYIDAFTVTGLPSAAVPAEYQSTARTNGAIARKTLTGLSYLEGKTVAVLAQGDVVSSGQDAESAVVVAGQIVLTRAAWLVKVGLPYYSDAETLDFENPQGTTLTGRQKRSPNVTIKVEASRGCWAGKDADHLNEVKQREFEDYGPTVLKTGNFEIGLDVTYDDIYGILVRQVDPLPLNILGIAPDIGFGG